MGILIGKPLTSTLLTSTFVFRSGGVPISGVRARVVFSGDFPGRVFDFFVGALYREFRELVRI